MRIFLSSNISCKADCKYCFSKWPDYDWKTSSEFEYECMSSNSIILYPCCDGDFFDQVELVEKIKSYTEFDKKVYISISSKINPTKNQIIQLIELNEWLIKAGNGFVKFAISLSNRTMLDEIEPATMTYEERIKLAAYIHSLGMPLSLTIKPILPFISKEEYDSILKDFSPYLNRVLIGGLYVNQSSEFYINYLRKLYPCTIRKVEWLPEQPHWNYVENEALMENIRISAQKLNMQVFDSDFFVVKSWMEEIN